MAPDGGATVETKAEAHQPWDPVIDGSFIDRFSDVALDADGNSHDGHPTRTARQPDICFHSPDQPRAIPLKFVFEVTVRPWRDCQDQRPPLASLTSRVRGSFVPLGPHKRKGSPTYCMLLLLPVPWVLSNLQYSLALPLSH
ncbi:hypothetical protein HRR80_008052 [Exophiala dermatitidis]|uniref:Uncharacterized protein n=1 Tax=Exophiala dermatitidis TaxID=5970 RepID=A0AAN6EPI4_EXODE|nr:hypothetical protein HRR80_008052 [Exophiala dermatitidis]